MGWADCVLRATDNEEDASIKRQTLPVFVILFAASLLLVVVWFPFNNVMDIGIYVATIATAALLLGFKLTGIAPKTLVIVSVLAMTATTILSDWDNARKLTPRTWSFSVIAIDASLVFSFPDKATLAIVAATLLWLAVDRLEATARLGVYEKGHFGDLTAYLEGGVIPLCSCASPPCAIEVLSSSIGYVQMVIVFLVDFHFTRGFAANMKKQLVLVKGAVNLCAIVTESLSIYDIETAQKAIDSSTDLPEGLVASYRRLVSNLMIYRDYLPDTLLHYEEDRQAKGVPAPVGEGGGGVDVGVVFTDIQSSTSLWEGYPKEMYTALRIHNATLREVAAENEGYEVKIIGDALMLVFKAVHDAVRFGAEAQLRLVQSEWP
eukprot:Hpha_TRINITY_DN16151_c4_g5::TRINITY_DN16151_c4_g5_i1::g.3961::m.3961